MLIGLTGGIGSGKSTLARFLAGYGAVLIDADQLGHQALAEPQVIAALRSAFGPGILDGSGRIDRRRLGAMAFADAAGFARLNHAVRPCLENLLWSQVAAAQKSGEGRVVVVDAALIYEWGVADRFDLMVVVDAPEELRCQRAAARQGLAAEEVRRRMQYQLPASTKAARADLVVANAGSVADLEQEAARVWQHIEALRRGGPAP